MDLDKDTFIFNMVKYGVKKNLAEFAYEKLKAREMYLLAFSGKLASGKDTLAVELLNKLNVKNPVHLYYGDALKNEVDYIFAQYKKVISGELSETDLAKDLMVDHEILLQIKDTFLEELATNPNINSRMRTKGVRKILQYWGTDVRRKQNENYWVDKTFLEVAAVAAKGETVYLTDLRFPNEVEAANNIGFTTIRLEVSPETQAARLYERDGIIADNDSLNHPSETALDNFNNFTAIINNDSSINEGIGNIIEKTSL